MPFVGWGLCDERQTIADDNKNAVDQVIRFNIIFRYKLKTGMFRINMDN